MPRGDGTGPAGSGPMGGRRAGDCRGMQDDERIDALRGRGQGGRSGPAPGDGRGRRLGRCAAHWWDAAGSMGRIFRYNIPDRALPETDVSGHALREREEALRSALDEVRRRLAELEPSGPS